MNWESAMVEQLSGRTIAVLATDGVEQVELVKALRDAGAEVKIVSDKKDYIQAFRHHDKSSSLEQINPDTFDGLVLPGGVINPDALELVPGAIAFVGHFVEQKKPIAAICHGPWTLIDAGGVRGRRLTSWPSLKTDLQNAGAEWVNQEVAVDEDLVTSRKLQDLPAFNSQMIGMFHRAAAGHLKT